MKNFFKYLSAGLGGALLMALAALKWFSGQDNSVVIKKIKIKRNPGSSDITIPIHQESSKKPRKSRLERRLDRNQGKIIKRNDKKKRKSANRLEKNDR